VLHRRGFGRCVVSRSVAVMLLWGMLIATHGSTAAKDDLFGGKHYAVWVETSMRRVMPLSRPDTAPHQPAMRISLARGEYESFQLALLAAPGQELQDVRLHISDLVSPTGNASISSDNVQWWQVGYVWVETLNDSHVRRNLTAVADAVVPGWWPDPLLPVECFSVKPDFAQAVWVTVYAPPQTPAGEYFGTITVSMRNEPSSTVSVVATVYDFTLSPGAGHCKTAFALHERLIAQVYGYLDQALRLQYGDFVLRHRLNPGNIYRMQPPVVSDLEHYLEGGMNCFPVIFIPNGEKSREWYRGQIEQFLLELKHSTRFEDLIKMAYVYGFDEVDEDQFATMEDLFGMVQEEFGLPTMTTGHVPQTPGAMDKLNIDWLCPITSWIDFEGTEYCRGAGHEVWSYISLMPYPPYANWRLDCPLVEARVLWWQAYHQKLDGFLYWSLNMWIRENNERPIDPTTDGPFLKWSVCTGGRYPWLYGDGVLIYPGVDGPIGSIRLENIRDGLEDYEYLWLLSSKLGDVEAGRQACLPVTRSLTSYTRDARVLYKQRDAIAKLIEESS